MLYRFLTSIPSELTGEIWDVFSRNSLLISVIIAITAGIFVILYLFLRYRISDHTRPFNITLSFWMWTIFFVVFHIVLVFWLSVKTFGVEWLDVLLSLFLWKIRLYNALSSTLEFFIIYYITAKIISLIFLKTRYMLWPRFSF